MLLREQQISREFSRTESHKQHRQQADNQHTRTIAGQTGKNGPDHPRTKELFGNISWLFFRISHGGGVGLDRKLIYAAM
jgi:hypothetical protein